MYIIGLILGILTAFIMNKMDGARNQDKIKNTLLIELPEYKAPNGRTILIYVWDKVKDYLTKAGTTIFLASIIIWFILNFGLHGMVEDMSESFGAILSQVFSSGITPRWFGLMADSSGINIRPCSKGSCCIQFQCIIWHNQY